MACGLPETRPLCGGLSIFRAQSSILMDSREVDCYSDRDFRVATGGACHMAVVRTQDTHAHVAAAVLRFASGAGRRLKTCHTQGLPQHCWYLLYSVCVCGGSTTSICMPHTSRLKCQTLSTAQLARPVYSWWNRPKRAC